MSWPLHTAPAPAPGHKPSCVAAGARRLTGTNPLTTNTPPSAPASARASYSVHSGLQQEPHATSAARTIALHLHPEPFLPLGSQRRSGNRRLHALEPGASGCLVGHGMPSCHYPYLAARNPHYIASQTARSMPHTRVRPCTTSKLLATPQHPALPCHAGIRRRLASSTPPTIMYAPSSSSMKIMLRCVPRTVDDAHKCMHSTVQTQPLRVHDHPTKGKRRAAQCHVVQICAVRRQYSSNRTG